MSNRANENLQKAFDFIADGSWLRQIETDDVEQMNLKG